MFKLNSYSNSYGNNIRNLEKKNINVNQNNNRRFTSIDGKKWDNYESSAIANKRLFEELKKRNGFK